MTASCKPNAGTWKKIGALTRFSNISIILVKCLKNEGFFETFASFRWKNMESVKNAWNSPGFPHFYEKNTKKKRLEIDENVQKWQKLIENRWEMT